jgi:hypothetical protein
MKYRPYRDVLSITIRKVKRGKGQFILVDYDASIEDGERVVCAHWTAARMCHDGKRWRAEYMDELIETLLGNALDHNRVKP